MHASLRQPTSLSTSNGTLRSSSTTTASTRKEADKPLNPYSLYGGCAAWLTSFYTITANLTVQRVPWHAALSQSGLESRRSRTCAEPHPGLQESRPRTRRCCCIAHGSSFGHPPAPPFYQYHSVLLPLVGSGMSPTYSRFMVYLSHAWLRSRPYAYSSYSQIRLHDTRFACLCTVCA